MKKKKVLLIIFLLILLTILSFAGFHIFQTVHKIKIQNTMEAQGGIRIRYKVSNNREALGKTGIEIIGEKLYGNPSTKKFISDLKNKICKNIKDFYIYQTEDDIVTIDMPGIDDADSIVEEIEKEYSLYFCTKVDDITPTKKQLNHKEYIELKNEKDNSFDGYYKVWMASDAIVDAHVGRLKDDNGKINYVINLQFNSEGTKTFAKMTSQNIGKVTYIIYNNSVLSHPNVNQQITGGQAEIYGNFKKFEEAEQLASKLEIGLKLKRYALVPSREEQ